MNETNDRERRKSTAFRMAAILILLILGAVTWWSETIRPWRYHGHPPSCVNNEKQIGIAFRGFGIDNGGFPMTVDRAANTNAVAEVAGVESPAGVPGDTTKP